MSTGELLREIKDNEMTCYMLSALRVYPYAENHKGNTLVRYCEIYNDLIFHRVLTDAEMTGNLWVTMIDEIKGFFSINHVSFELMQKLSRLGKAEELAFHEKVACKHC